jgi:type II secretory pathway component PulK
MTMRTRLTTLATAFKQFLLRERTLGRTPPPPARRRRNRQRGVALIAVLISIAISLVIVNEFGTSTSVDLTAAANYRDQMRSHFLARSALNLSELVIRIQQRIDNVQQMRDAGIRITDFADQVLLAFCGNPEQVQGMVGFSSSDVKGLGVDIGTCGIVGQQITTEDDKINLNCANGPKATQLALKTTLDALVYFPAYDPVFEEADAENYRRDRATQVSAIIDYIDADGSHLQDIGTTEEYGYESLKDHYKPKNTYLDTIGEVRLARGVDDRFWTLFGPAFTVYGGCKVNLSALSNTQLIAGLLLITAKNKNDPMLADPMKLFALAGLVAKAKQFGMSFNKPEEFADFVKDPAAQLGLLAGKSGTLAGSAAAAAGPLVQQLTGGQKLGLELDINLLKSIATAGPRRTYRVEAFGEIERKQRGQNGEPVFPAIRSTITGVWDTKVVPQNVRKPPVPKGTWVFLRED